MSCAGTARNTAFRKPVSTSTRMISPSITTRPIASAHVIWLAIENATNALSPSPVASASGKFATTPIRIVSTPATSAVAAAIAAKSPPAEEVAVHVGAAQQDDRVEHDDVGHREERDDPAADLTGDGRAALGDLEEPVEPARGGPGAGTRAGLRVLAHERQHGRAETAVCGTLDGRRRLAWAPWNCATSSRRSTRSATGPTSSPTSSRSTSTACAPSRSAPPCGCRVRGPAAVLRPARGRRPAVVAVDLPGRLRARAVRPGVLPPARKKAPRRRHARAEAD